MSGRNKLRRTAVVVASSGRDPRAADYLHGVEIDKKRYVQFLQAPTGGAWSASEIHVLTNPSFGALRGVLDETHRSDFTVTIFCGRGDHEAETGDPLLYIDGRHATSAYALRTHAPRQLLIADACRRPRLRKPLRAKSARGGSLRTESDSAYRRTCRALYDCAFLTAQEGRSDLYSCKVKQSSAEDPLEGALFSQLLVDLSVAWAETSRSGSRASSVLTLPDAVATVSNALVERRERQIPKLISGQRVLSFPFAVA